MSKKIRCPKCGGKLMVIPTDDGKVYMCWKCWIIVVPVAVNVRVRGR